MYRRDCLCSTFVTIHFGLEEENLLEVTCDGIPELPLGCRHEFLDYPGGVELRSFVTYHADVTGQRQPPVDKDDIVIENDTPVKLRDNRVALFLANRRTKILLNSCVGS